VKVEVVKEGVWEAGAKLGLKYAAVVSDYNPIHLYGVTAKLFGFRKPIAHGMYFAAKGFHEAFDAFKAAGEGRARTDTHSQARTQTHTHAPRACLSPHSLCVHLIACGWLLVG
jgi:acyl dehydratase